MNELNNNMKKNKILLPLLLLWTLCQQAVFGQTGQPAPPPPENVFLVRGFAIGGPKVKEVDRFVKFINEELATRKVNTLILRIDFNYEFESYPQLRDSIALSKSDVKKIVDACAKNKIRIIPQINLLGHQSWAGTLHNLLRVYPEFDETPGVIMPEKYVWPNADGLYCKSYCPLHPDVHKVVFALVDEICDAFHADAFHAGMDEVFYLGNEKCPRCSGIDKAELFAGEVRTIRDHLALKNRELWIWGDRLIDGKATGIGLWEASYNYTYRAVDLIPKDVVICDWHYERPDQTAVYFAMKGLRVVTCAWNRPQVALSQVENYYRARAVSGKELRPRFYGMAETIWSSPSQFLDGYYGKVANPKDGDNTPWNTFKVMFDRMGQLEQAAPATK